MTVCCLETWRNNQRACLTLVRRSRWQKRYLTSPWAWRRAMHRQFWRPSKFPCQKARCIESTRTKKLGEVTAQPIFVYDWLPFLSCHGPIWLMMLLGQWFLSSCLAIFDLIINDWSLMKYESRTMVRLQLMTIISYHRQYCDDDNNSSDNEDDHQHKDHLHTWWNLMDEYEIKGTVSLTAKESFLPAWLASGFKDQQYVLHA